MSIRETTRKMTGRLTQQPEIVLGTRATGGPGVTIHFNYDAGYGCYANPVILETLIEELQVAIEHLKGKK
jgi:hypothetical protein